MKTKLLLAASVLLLSAPALTARNDSPQRHTAISYKTENNDCNMPVSQTVLDINNVRAGLLDGGDMWFNTTTSTAAYEVPKGTAGGQNPNAIYAGAIWISGIAAGNNLKLAATTYRQNGGTDFFSGPLDNTGNTILATCNLWDRHFPVWSSQISPLVAAYQAALTGGGTPGSITLPISSVSDSVKFWPGKGNPYLSALGYDVSGPLAPFYDADGDGVYDPAHGDYPTIAQGGISPSAFGAACGGPAADSLAFARSDSYADQMIYWVMNDKGNVHGGSGGGVALGVQINALAFAFQTNDAVNDMTFYRYHVINKSGAVLDHAIISQYTDPDLGCPYNDRVGCDTTRNLAFVYNGVPQGTPNTPGLGYVADLTGSAACSGGAIGYGNDLPVLGIAMVETPTDTVTYPDPLNPSVRIHKEVGMGSFMSYQNTASGMGDPWQASEFRNYQTGLWKDGTALTYGGNGYQYSTSVTPFMYPGDPAISTQWSECNPQIGTAIAAYDRRFVQSTRSFTFLPCASQYLTIAVTFTRPLNSNCPGLSTVTALADSAQQTYNNARRMGTATGLAELTRNLFQMFPNPVSARLTISGIAISVEQVNVYDLTGRLVQTQAGSDIRSIDMSALTEGVYMVSVKSGDKTSTQKIAKR